MNGAIAHAIVDDRMVSNTPIWELARRTGLSFWAVNDVLRNLPGYPNRRTT